MLTIGKKTAQLGCNLKSQEYTRAKDRNMPRKKQECEKPTDL